VEQELINSPPIEVKAYSCILASATAQACRILDRLDRALETVPLDRRWRQPVDERSLAIRRACEDRPEAATQIPHYLRAENPRTQRLESCA
jgi:hypothetical protein